MDAVIKGETLIEAQAFKRVRSCFPRPGRRAVSFCIGPWMLAAVAVGTGLLLSHQNLWLLAGICAASSFRTFFLLELYDPVLLRLTLIGRTLFFFREWEFVSGLDAPGNGSGILIPVAPTSPQEFCDKRSINGTHDPRGAAARVKALAERSGVNEENALLTAIGLCEIVLNATEKLGVRP